MKITKIHLQNFRAYDEPFELALSGGKNLLLHGENGSGKTSLYQAFRCFFEERGADLTAHRNEFSPPDRPQEISITFQSNAGEPPVVTWTSEGGHPIRLPSGQLPQGVDREVRRMLVEASRRSGFLDYRALLRTNLYSKPKNRRPFLYDDHEILYGVPRDGIAAQLFDLATDVVLSGARVELAGGGEANIGDLTRDLWNSRPQSRHRRPTRQAEAAAARFNAFFAAKLPEIEPLVSSFLAHFTDGELELSFEPVNVSWNIRKLCLDGAVLMPNLRFRGREISNWQDFLNEARLSALAICLFLAGTRLSDNDYNNPVYPRFLFLDDALIGLEVQNRLPILDILKRPEFRHYQIFLFTHDRVWFDLARGHLPCDSGWMHHELIGDETTGHLIPKSQPCEADLEIARKHLGNRDLKAAAVYARSAFEWKLRKVCETNGIKIPFKPEADKVGAGVMWDGVVARQREREHQRIQGSQVPDFVPPALEQAVETMRSTVLNKLSHSGSSGLVSPEVAAALVTVRAVMDHTFPKIRSNPNS